MKKQRTIVLFLGPPGSGKGSLSQLCVKRLGWQQLSTGNLCREHIAKGTDIGQKIDFAIKSGKLITDSLIVGMVDDWLKNRVSGDQTVIFDGFPRTVPQAESLHKLVQTRDDITLELVRLTLTDEALVERLLARSICQNTKCQLVYSIQVGSSQAPRKPMTCDDCESPLERRSDDEQTAIKERLRIYHEHEKGLLAFYEATGHLITTVEASTPLEEVYGCFLETAGYHSV